MVALARIPLQSSICAVCCDLNIGIGNTMGDGGAATSARLKSPDALAVYKDRLMIGKGLDAGLQVLPSANDAKTAIQSFNDQSRQLFEQTVLAV
jgi:hypothetical protein